MKLNWFLRRGLFYKPIALPGWIILAIAIGLSIYTFIDIDSRSHSVSDTLINFFFNLLLIGLSYTLIAFLTEQRPLRPASKD
jgi:hypothetical protein